MRIHPCLFCGYDFSKDDVDWTCHIYQEVGAANEPFFMVVCHECMGYGPKRSSLEQAVFAWNELSGPSESLMNIWEETKNYGL
jgi:hypothetical protein